MNFVEIEGFDTCRGVFFRKFFAEQPNNQIKAIVRLKEDGWQDAKKYRVKKLGVFLMGCLIWSALGAGAAAQQCVEKNTLIFDGIPEIPQRITQSLRRYQHTRSASLHDWLPAGQGILISTRLGETSQLHRVEQPGGRRQQISFFDEPVGSAVVSPNPTVNGFLFTKDVGGSEFFQLFFFDFATGQAQRLTDGQSRNGWARWSHQGDRFVFSSTRRNGRDWDLYLVDINQPEHAEPILEAEGKWTALDWSPDGTQLLVRRRISVHESPLYTLDLKTKALTQFQPTPKPVAYGGALYAKDGKGVYFASDRHGEFLQLQYYHFETQDLQVLTAHIPWDVEPLEKNGGFALSPNGSYLAFTVNEGGNSKLHVLDTQSLKEFSLPSLPVGKIASLKFSPDGRRLGFGLSTPQSPSDVYTLDLASKTSVRWTYSEIGGLKREDFVVPELIHYETFDKVDGQPRRIPALYYKPQGAGPFPVLVRVHGGPESQARPTFKPTIQYYVNELGIAVVAPNVRGSRGYGKSYLRLDNEFKREDAVRDIGKLLDWIAAQPELDASRIAVRGGSYGGYMALAALAHYSDRLRAAVSLVGMSNFVTFLENTQEYRRARRRVEYGDEREPEMRAFLTQISPIARAADIAKPLFVVQGLNDPRVPVSESEQIVNTVRENEGTAWYLLATDEGHGFRKKTNRNCFESAASLFWERYLLEGGDGKERADQHDVPSPESTPAAEEGQQLAALAD